jgi:HEAT repeat protein
MHPTPDEQALVRTILHDPDFRRARAAAGELLHSGVDLRTAATNLAAGLRHSDNFVRRRAAQALGVLGAAATPAVPALLAALDDTSWTVREAIVQALSGLPADDAVRAALAACTLHDRNPLVREAAARAALRRGADAVGEFGPALRHAHASVRRRAAQALALFPLGTAGVIPLLRAALEDSHVKVRLAAVRALGDRDAEAVEALPRLVRCAFEGDARVHLAAAEAVDRLLTQPQAAPLRWLGEGGRLAGDVGATLRTGLKRPDLPVAVREEFVAACVRRRRWHRRRHGLEIDAATVLDGPWDEAAATASAATGQEAEFAWVLGWLCELWLRDAGTAP